MLLAFKVYPKIRGTKNVLLATCEATVGLSLSTYRWKALPKENLNRKK